MIMPTPSMSHQQPALCLCESLLEKGHLVTYISPGFSLPVIVDNLTFVNVSTSTPTSELALTKDFQKKVNRESLFVLIKNLIFMVENQILSASFKEFLRHTKENQIVFDAIIVESYHGVLLGSIFSSLFNATKIIGFCTGPGDFWFEGELGSAVNPFLWPLPFNPYSNEMTFLEKIDNWWSLYLINGVVDECWTETELFLAKNFNFSSVTLMEDVSSRFILLLISSNFLYHHSRLLGPNILELGPLHIKKPRALPQDLQKWMDDAKEGVIFFSLGSKVKSESMSLTSLKAFVKAFAELGPQIRVVWKLNAVVHGVELSENIMIKKWLPQQDILAHPKVKLFITQGGLQSFQEAMHYGVPLIGIPWYGDQISNVKRMVSMGIGLQMDVDNITYENVRTEINKILTNESFTENMASYSKMSRDFTSKSKETAVWWIEYALRHQDFKDLKTSKFLFDFSYLCYFFILACLSLSLCCISFCSFKMLFTVQFLQSHFNEAPVKPKSS